MKRLSLFPKKQTQQTESPAALDAYWSLTTEQLLAGLHTTSSGIQQADAESRIKQYRPSTLKAQLQITAIGLLLSQFKSPLVLILIFASIVSAFVGEWTDAIIVLAVVIGSTMLGFVQEYRASNAVEKLCSQMTIRSSVLRDGKPQMVPSEQVVPGDVVLFSAGSLIPDDGIVLETNDFFGNQARHECRPESRLPRLGLSLQGYRRG
jgi:P-type Mg2+ transporter